MVNNNVGGYFQNPVAGYINTIITLCGTIFNDANTAGFDDLANTASALSSNASLYLTHTNKVSGVTSMDGATDLKINPYYKTATAYGKQATFITNQTDGIANSSPTMGCMTSILVGPQISANANTVAADSLLVLTATQDQANTIQQDLMNVSNYLNYNRTNDVAFFGRLVTMVDNYNATRSFSSMGDTETFLCNNIVGTDKLKARIN